MGSDGFRCRVLLLPVLNPRRNDDPLPLLLPLTAAGGDGGRRVLVVVLVSGDCGGVALRRAVQGEGVAGGEEAGEGPGHEVGEGEAAAAGLRPERDALVEVGPGARHLLGVGALPHHFG
jgi:hypothetical protein